MSWFKIGEVCDGGVLSGCTVIARGTLVYGALIVPGNLNPSANAKLKRLV